MKKELLAVLALLAGASVGFAQPRFIPISGSDAPVPVASFESSNGNAPRGWVSVDYLHWWVTNGPVNVPLVTTGNPASATGGAIGDPSTRVLFGNSSVNFGGLNGGRVSAGYWFGCDSRVGVEASGFLFQQRSSTFSAASDAAGNPLLALPFQTTNGVEARTIISTPTIQIAGATPQTGGVTITSTTRLWGADFNGVLNVYRDCNCSLDLLAGFRYFDLQESLTLNANTHITLVPERVGGITRRFDATLFDNFNTRNQFYGGQLGSRAAYQTGRFSAEFLGLVALGSTQHLLYNGGATGVFLNGVQQAGVPGGQYTKTSNLGNFHTSSFSVIPQAQVKLGYDITKHLRATIGYDLMFWNNVNRPGNEIDHVIGPQPGTRPAPLDNHSSIWAQGVSVGLEYRW